MKYQSFNLEAILKDRFSDEEASVISSRVSESDQQRMDFFILLKKILRN